MKNELSFLVAGRVIKLVVQGGGASGKNAIAHLREKFRAFLVPPGKSDFRMHVFMERDTEAGLFSRENRKALRRYHAALSARFPEDDNIERSFPRYFATASYRETLDLLRKASDGEKIMLKSSRYGAVVCDAGCKSGVLCVNRNTPPPRAMVEIKDAFLMAQSVVLSASMGMVLHGCGIIDKNAGYVFLGLSGAGKTTLGTLYNKNRVLSDDALPLVPSGRCPVIFPSPLRQVRPTRRLENRGYPVKAGFFLVKDRKTFSRPVRKSYAMAHILGHHVHYLRLYGERGLKKIFAGLGILVDTVPFYELHFEKNRIFISELSKI